MNEYITLVNEYITLVDEYITLMVNPDMWSTYIVEIYHPAQCMLGCYLYDNLLHLYYYICAYIYIYAHHLV